MLRIILFACVFLATVESVRTQEYHDKNEDRATRMGVVTVANGEVTIKKKDDVYTIDLSVEVIRDGRDQSARGTVALIFLDANGQPTFCPLRSSVSVSSSGGAFVTAGMASTGIDMNAKTFESAIGYMIVVKSESKNDIPHDIPALKEFLKTVPSWEKAVTAYNGLKAGDKSKAVGAIVMRRLK